jgi:hypothetical protein
MSFCKCFRASNTTASTKKPPPPTILKGAGQPSMTSNASAPQRLQMKKGESQKGAGKGIDLARYQQRDPNVIAKGADDLVVDHHHQ